MLIALLVAAAAAPVEVVGFSADDKYVAWIEHGTSEGSGFPWARLHVTDVARSADAVPAVQVTLDSGKEGDTEEAAVQRARSSAQSMRGMLGVSSWVSPRVIQHDAKGEMSDRTGAPIGTVELKQREGKGKCEEPFRALLLKLTVLWLDDDRPSKIADEKKPPRERPCATGCALGDIYAHGKAALVFAKCGVQGFEGPATKYTAYTAKLTYGLDEPLPAQ